MSVETLPPIAETASLACAELELLPAAHRMQLELGQLELRYATLRIVERARISRLAGSLAEQGQHSPVLVVTGGESHRYVLIDGYARVAALKLLADDLVDALLLELPEEEALLLSYRLDARRRRSALEEGWLLRELVKTHQLTLRKLSVMLGRSTSWISRRLALVQLLPPSVQQAVQSGKIGAQVATRFLVPLARANAEHCERLVERLDGQAVSVRQMKRLYVTWRAGDQEQRQRIVEHPQLFLHATEADQDDIGDGAAALLIHDLNTIAGVSARAERRLDEQVYRDGTDRDRRRLNRAFEGATSRFDALRGRFDEERRDAGSGHPHGDSAAPS